jgi:hypothetical protein
MRIRVSDPDHVPALLAFLRQRPDCVAEQAGRSHIAVSLLGSRDVEQNVTELEERLEPWRAKNSGVLVELLEAY